jgi:hypothetical protein
MLNAVQYINILICLYISACIGSQPNLWMRSHLYECADTTYPWGFPLMLRIDTEQGETRYPAAGEWMLLGRSWVRETTARSLRCIFSIRLFLYTPPEWTEFYAGTLRHLLKACQTMLSPVLLGRELQRDAYVQTSLALSDKLWALVFYFLIRIQLIYLWLL